MLTDTIKAAFKDMFDVVGETDFDMGLGEAIEATGMPVDVDMTKLLPPAGY